MNLIEEDDRQYYILIPKDIASNLFLFDAQGNFQVWGEAEDCFMEGLRREFPDDEWTLDDTRVFNREQFIHDEHPFEISPLSYDRMSADEVRSNSPSKAAIIDEAFGTVAINLFGDDEHPFMNKKDKVLQILRGCVDAGKLVRRKVGKADVNTKASPSVLGKHAMSRPADGGPGKKRNVEDMDLDGGKRKRKTRKVAKKKNRRTLKKNRF